MDKKRNFVSFTDNSTNESYIFNLNGITLLDKDSQRVTLLSGDRIYIKSKTIFDDLCTEIKRSI